MVTLGLRREVPPATVGEGAAADVSAPLRQSPVYWLVALGLAFWYFGRRRVSSQKTARWFENRTVGSLAPVSREWVLNQRRARE